MRRYVALHPNLTRSEEVSSEASIKPFKNEILEYLQKLEGCCSTLNSSMINNQPEIDWDMRQYIIDFIMELQYFFRHSQETFFLACSIADKYCCKRIVYKRHYYLLGATALWIAAKYQDKKTRIPTLRELTLLCRRLYEPKMFVQMERHILSTLDWSVGSTVSAFDVVQWLHSTSSVKTLPKNTEFLSLVSFLCDLTLYEKEFMDYTSPVKAIAVLLLSCKVTRNDSFPLFLNQLIDDQIKWGKFSDSNDLCFHIAGDSLTDDFSLSLNFENLQSIKRCLYHLLKEIFQDKSRDGFPISRKVLFKKYKEYPIGHWLYDFKKENIDIVSQLISFSNSLPSTDSYSIFSDWIWDSIFNFIDKLIGLQGNYESMEEDELMIDDDFSSLLLGSQPYCYDSNVQPVSNFNENDTSASLLSSSSTLNSSSIAALQSFNNYNVPVRQTKIGSSQNIHHCPPTPHSANSTFSGKIRTSDVSSTTSVSTKSCSSPALKKPSRSDTHQSPGHNQLVILREVSNLSDYFD